MCPGLWGSAGNRLLQTCGVVINRDTLLGEELSVEGQFLSEQTHRVWHRLLKNSPSSLSCRDLSIGRRTKCEAELKITCLSEGPRGGNERTAPYPLPPPPTGLFLDSAPKGRPHWGGCLRELSPDDLSKLFPGVQF